MRLWLIPLASLAIVTTPVSAETRSASSTNAPTCAASLQKVDGAAGYKMVRNCGTAIPSAQAASFQVARQPVEDASNLDGGSFILAFLALLSFGAGIYFAVDDDGDGAGGLDPASP